MLILKLLTFTIELHVRHSDIGILFAFINDYIIVFV